MDRSRKRKEGPTFLIPMAAALLNLLLHRCHVFHIKDRRYRLRDLERVLK